MNFVDRNLISFVHTLHHQHHCEETSSPPSSMPSPLNLLSTPMRGLSPVGGCKLSKFSRLRASLAANGVFAVAGVRHAACAGLGVTLR
jgi:hypothetical protein